MNCMGQIVAGFRSAALAILAAALLTGCAWWEVKQRQLALRPTLGVPPASVQWQPGDTRYSLQVPAEDGPARTEALALWWLPHANPQAPTLLYLHGTFRHLGQNLPKIDALREAGFAVLAVDYRGWGESAAIVPTEASIHADARTAWDELRQRQPQPGRRVIFGHSMGGAVAVALASELQQGRDYGALILESTFTRLPEVAAVAGFWGRLAASVTSLEFDSLSRVAKRRRAAADAARHRRPHRAGRPWAAGSATPPGRACAGWKSPAARTAACTVKHRSSTARPCRNLMALLEPPSPIQSPTAPLPAARP
jgi:alpha-beta hydrolase superfamily lysophospholipase